MKKFLFTMVTLLAMAVSSQAMSYEQARQQALFLADKMAYELNLTEEQYEACYEVNLDYLMRVSNEYDLYGEYWNRRNLDLSYILLDWQYSMFLNASYFYRPLYWSSGYWHFGIYSRYPSRNYYYFGRPTFWISYRGGHAWHNNGGRSWYNGRDFASRSYRNDNYSNRGDRYQGMRDGFNNGSYGRGKRFDNNDSRQYGTRSIGQSSTRSTVGINGIGTSRNGSTSNGPRVGFGTDRGSTVDRGTRSFGNSSDNRSNFQDRGNSSVDRSTRSFGNSSDNRSTFQNRGNSSVDRSTRSFGNSSSSSPSVNRSVGSSISRPSSSSSMGPSSRSGSMGGSGNSGNSRGGGRR